MTLAELTPRLDALGIKLSLRLVVDAPLGAVTPELREALSTHKPLLLQRLARETAWAVLASWRWGPAVGRTEPVTDSPGPRDPARLAECLGGPATLDAYAIAEREAMQREA